MPTWGAALPCSSMAERPAVNGAVVGSSPTRAAIHCRMDNWQVALTLNQGEAGSTPAPASNFDGKYANRQSDLTLNQVFEGSIPSFPANHTPVAQLAEAAVSKTVCCRYLLRRRYALAEGEAKRYKSY